MNNITTLHPITCDTESMVNVMCAALGGSFTLSDSGDWALEPVNGGLTEVGETFRKQFASRRFADIQSALACALDIQCEMQSAGVREPYKGVFCYTHNEGVTPLVIASPELHCALIKDDLNDLTDALGMSSALPDMVIGDEHGTGLELRTGGKGRYTCYVQITMGGACVIEYLMPSAHDALCFLREFAPTITGLADAEDAFEMRRLSGQE